MNVLIIIPAYNEAENISRVVTELQDFGYNYVVINDGSTDETSTICKEHGYNLIDMPVNVGLSGVIQTGMKYAYIAGYDGAIQLDGDGQHDPQYLNNLIAQMKQEKSDIVIGSRFVNKKKPTNLRMLGSNFIQFVIYLTTGISICDPTSGLRLYNRKMLYLFSKDFNLTPEPDTISYLLRCGIKISEIQVEMRERIAGESYLNLTRSIQYMLRMIISILLIQWFRIKKDIKEEVTV